MTPGTPGNRYIWLGLAIAGVALLGIVSNLLFPWMVFHGPFTTGGEVMSWSDLRNPDALAYEQRLLVWPLVAFPLVAAGGLTIAGTAWWVKKSRDGPDEIARATHAPWRDATYGFALWIMAAGGFLLALTGTRWLGFYFAKLAQTGSSPVHLHVVPYLNLSLGVLLLVGAAWALTRLIHARANRYPLYKWSLLAALAAALGLLLAPLLPYAKLVSFGTTIPLEEFTIAVLGEQGGQGDQDGTNPPTHLARARLALWATLVVSLVGVLAAQIRGLGVRHKLLDQAPRIVLANVFFILAGALFTVLFYEGLGEWRNNVESVFNPVLPLVWVALIVIWGFALREVIRPNHAFDVT